jgi:CDP-diacylglycerol--glycerol-3-phosphate 3-phosphatidyltransferase
VSGVTQPGARGARSDPQERALAGARAPASGVSPRAVSERMNRRFSDSAIATPANFVTVARLLLAIPTLLLIVDRGSSWLTVSLWFVLACTDSVDGWLARRDGTTRSGAFLDPLADKFLVIGGFTALAITGDFSWAAVFIIASREVGISVYRSFAGRRGISLPAGQLGKWKAFSQYLAVGVVLFPPTYEWATVHDAILWVAIGLTVVSGLDILRRGWGQQVKQETEHDAAGADAR